MHITNLFSKTVLASSIILLSSVAFANEHDMMDMSHMQHDAMQMDETDSKSDSDMQMDSVPQNQMQHSSKNVSEPIQRHDIDQSKHSKHSELEENSLDISHESQNTSSAMKDHMRDHGGQIFQATSLENKWMLNDSGQGTLQSKLKSWIGTDENKLFIEGHLEKAESHAEHYDISALYSRNVAKFWDVQAGVRYRNDQSKPSDKQQVDAQIGIHGLAPYFFETAAYLYAGKDSQISMSLEIERDILLTQKLILQPYLDATVLISDDSKYAKKTGLSSLQTGLQTRYEINKKIMPFIDIAYSYENGDESTAWQSSTKSESGWIYGAGITFKF